MNLGELSGYTKAGRKELGGLLEEMITTGSYRMSYDASVYDDAVKLYAHWRDLHPQSSSSGNVPDNSLTQALESQRRDVVTISLSKVTNHEPRVIGPEVICRSTTNRLGLMEFLLSNGFDCQEAELAVMQIIARAIYPYSEYRTVKYLRDNTALAEMFHIPKERLTKDALYRSALRLWDVHRRMEDWLHERVRSMFNLEEIRSPLNLIIEAAESSTTNIQSAIEVIDSNARRIDQYIRDIEVKGNDELLMERIMKCINDNISNSDLIQNIRMEQAARLLTEQKINITQVAYAVGYSSQPSFSAAFRKHFGVSPTEYISQHQ